MVTTVTNNPYDATQGTQSEGSSTPAGGGIIGGTIQNMATPTGPQSYTAQQREVNRQTETAAGQVESLLAKDSPLMQRARTLAMQGMNQRGLVNSSMSQGAGVAAMIDRITPIAQQDAQTYGTRSLANQQAVNDANQFNVGQNNQVYSQKLDQGFKTSERESGQQYQTSERLGSQAFATTFEVAKQNFTAAQAELDRAQENALSDKSIAAQQALQTAQQNFTSAQSALDRAQQTAMLEKQQDFTATQNSLDRSQQFALQNAAQMFQATEAEKSRAGEIMLADKNITAQKALEAARQEFQRGESALDRAQQVNLQTAQQNFTAAQSELDRAHQNAINDKSIEAQKALQNAQQTFQTAQNELDRVQQTKVAQAQIDANKALSDANQQFQAAQNKLERDQQEAMTRLADSLNQANVSKTFAGNLAISTSSAINSIVGDANLTPDAKRGAIQNVIDGANSTMQWGSTFYNTTLPTIAVPGGGAGVVTPGAGAGGGAPSASRAPAAAEVAAAYREFLGRDPESNEVIQGNLSSGQTLEQIRRNIAQSPEAIERARTVR